MPHVREGVRPKLPHATLLLQGMQAKRKEGEEVKQQPMLKVEEAPTDSLIPYANNAKIHTNEHAPQIKWVVSFADGTQCGDGAIYRASNFVLTGITKNSTIYEFPDGARISSLTLRAQFDCQRVRTLCRNLGVPVKYRKMSEWEALGARPLDGYMFRYVYFIDKSYRKRLAVPEIPFSKIDEIGAGMYKGEKVSVESRKPE